MKPQKMKGRSLLKIKIPAETDNDASKFPRTVFQIAPKKKKKNLSSSGLHKMLLTCKRNTSETG